MTPRAKDPSDIDLMANYSPLPKQTEFHASQAKWRLLSSGFGGGKTKCGCREAIIVALAYPGSLGVIARKSYRPLLDSTWRTFQRELIDTGLEPWVAVRGGKSPTSPPEVEFPAALGGSKIVFRNADNEMNFFGMEPDWVFIDEGSEVEDIVYETILGRLRGTPNPNGRVRGTRIVDGVETEAVVSGPLRAWIATNPGPSAWIRRQFAPPGTEGLPKDGFEGIFMSTYDNPYLPQQYIDDMEATYVGSRREALLNGSWAAFEGQIFTMFDTERHVTRDYVASDLPGYEFIEGWDFGRAAETAVVWTAYDPEWRRPAYVLGCYSAKETSPDEHAVAVRSMRRMLGLDKEELVVVGDPAGTQRGSSGSYITEYAAQGIYIAPCNLGKSIRVRDDRLAQMLAHELPIRGGEPALQFCDRTKNVRVEILAARYQGATLNGEVREGHVKKGDHNLDGMCYGLMMVPWPPAYGGRSDVRRYGASVSIQAAWQDLQDSMS